MKKFLDISKRHFLRFIVFSLLLSLLSACSFLPFSPFSQESTTSSFTSSSKGLQIVNTAKSQLGVRYILGGASPKGFDCSGLIWWAYKQHGIAIPRVTRDQAYAGRAVSLNALQPADIIVFAQAGAPNSLHTALYIGNNEFIHSPNSKSHVRIESLTSTYWKKYFALARRVI